MKRIRNKKLATVVVIFLLVFIMAGAFAAFQTVLDVRGRVNMYAPSVDAIIADLIPIAAPMGLFSVVDDPDGFHDSNTEVQGPWLGLGTGVNLITTRFDDREFIPVPWSVSNPVAPGLVTLDDTQTLGGNTENTPVTSSGGWTTWLTTEDEARRLLARNAAWWAWGHGGAGLDSVPANNPFARPVPARVNTAAVVEPSEFETLYLNLSFDNFSQFYYFNLVLANVGVVELEVEDVAITRVVDPGDASPAWVVEPGPNLTDAFEMLQENLDLLNLNDPDLAAQLHPFWVDLATDLSAAAQGAGYVPVGLLDGLVNITVNLDPSDTPVGTSTVAQLAAGQNNGWDSTASAVRIPVTDGAVGAGATNNNTVAVGLRFCVALQNWENLMLGFLYWGPALLDATYGAPTAPTGSATWVGWAADEITLAPAADHTEVDDPEALILFNAITSTLFDRAVSGTFRIEYTVVPVLGTGTRPGTGVVPTP